MTSITKSLFLVLFLLVSLNVAAQQVGQTVDEEYTVENVFGINKGTNGGLISGFYYRQSKFLNDGNLVNYGIELVNIKHPRETKETTITGSSYVFGKSNYLLALRPTYGREKILFKKAPQQGARITAMVAAGPSIGIEVPYFLEFNGNRKEQYDPADPSHARNFIIGTAGPFRGLGRSKFVLGGHAKASLTFETNSSKKKVFGVEVGMSLDVYTRKINIIPESENNSSFAAAFLAVYFGRRR
ncbi:hypothetical protein [Roseivirga misakiensis]|uniref:Outer membrane protein beta-barrel domain-containing protein n=1 Tax=Roseivirga misakiensis TaxID=1563681 RepID=A0A1E5T4K1_9BACT|nr:hypothetical protein [Roseivirga misakiensis]OEK06305.1 hypothetical protein BFP71_01110 [Roseivirga misakiensis]